MGPVLGLGFSWYLLLPTQPRYPFLAAEGPAAAPGVHAVALVLRGKPVPGLGVGGRYVGHPYYSAWFERLLGCKPFPGTLNFDGGVDWRELAGLCEPLVVPETVWEGRRLGAVYAWRARVETIGGPVEALVIRPLLSRHPPRVLELVSCRRLRDLLPEGEVRIELLCPGGGEEGFKEEPGG